MDRRLPARVALVLLVAALLAGLLYYVRSQGGSGKDESEADTLVRERAAAWFNAGVEPQLGKARAELAPLVARQDPAFEDLVRAAIVEYADSQPEAAAKFLDRAEKLRADAPQTHYLRGQIARDAGDYERALPHLRRAHELAPADLPTQLALADVEGELDHVAEAEALYRRIVEVGIENAGNWYVSAVYRLARLLTNSGREQEAERYYAMFQALEKRGIKQASPLILNLGKLASLGPPAPHGIRSAPVPPLPAFAAGPLILPELGGAAVLEALDLDGDARIDLLAQGPRGIAAALRTDDGWSAKQVSAGAAGLSLAFDVDNDADLDLLVEEQGALSLSTFADGAWTRSPLVLPALPSPALGAVAVDYDHEGDLDLLVVGAFGSRMWRNDGAAVPELKGGYTDASAESGLPASGSYRWALTEDFDGDNDVDFLIGGPDELFLADSLRAGRFADATARFPAGTRFPSAPLAADLDGDARPDLVSADAIWFQQQDQTFRREARAAAPWELGPARPALVDLDLDGTVDLVAPSTTAGTSAHVTQSLGLGSEHAGAIAGDVRGPLAAADLDDDRDFDLAIGTERGVTLLTGAGNGNHGVPVSWRGLRDNRRAVGSIVEYRSRGIYRRIYWRGEPVLIGVGKNDSIDVLRITWPNGTVTTTLDAGLAPQEGVDDPDGAFKGILQPSGQVGSCPFLYTWNGTTYTFVTDVLGITPLGLPIAPGMLVPPDHDEYVLVRGDQLVPKEGFLELQFTEELREVTYLDQVRVLAVDHPAGSEIYPNELFTFPPFPEAKTHVVRAPLAPVRATGSDGKDWTAAVAAIDDVHALPFTLQPLQFAGMTEPWFLELGFDRDLVRNAKALRLLLTGWFFWSDASANMAAARDPRAEFVPPILQVPDGQGGWRDSGPPVGFPAGKTKTMVLDVGSILQRDDPRIRVFTTLRLNWDAIRLATDAGDEELRTTAIEPASATLWRRGFSMPLEALPYGSESREDRPERFDWDRLAPLPRWNQHPGRYTRYGETLELVTATDDRYVILGAGDALTVRLDARALPPPAAGFTRDWLVFLDGWAKDRDPNTIEALEVEPLPFHAMSGYPYRADERFPEDEAHRAWREQWNTRPAHEWIAPVSPARERAWRGEQ